MTENSTKLDALGELLGVEDDTRDLERPEARRPAVGEILRSSATAEPPIEPTAVRNPPAHEEQRVEQDGVDVIAHRSRRQRGDNTRPPTQPASPDTPRSRRQRTSANLPVGLVERLLDAKRHRWELSELVASALDHVDLDPRRADDILNASWNSTRVQRAYQLSADDIARIDAIASRWRMNRSQVLTTILPDELERLGL